MEADFLWTLVVISLSGCLITVRADCFLGCPNGEYCCGDKCCELVEGISGKTWTFISTGISAFIIIVVVVICCVCVRNRRAKQANQGMLVTTYPQPNAMPTVIRTVPEAQMEKGISNSAYTGRPQVVTAPHVYTVQHQNPSSTPGGQPIKSSAFGYNGSYKMDQHYYAQAQAHTHVTKPRDGETR